MVGSKPKEEGNLDDTDRSEQIPGMLLLDGIQDRNGRSSLGGST